MLAFTLERYLAVCRPVLDSQASIGKVRRIIAGIWLFVSLYCSPWFWLTETVPISFDVDGYREAERCDFKFSHEPHAYATVFIADLLLFYIIPLGICSLLYAKMGLVLYKSIRGAGGSSRNRTLRVSETGDSIELYALTRTGSIGSDRARKIVRSRIQVVRMLGLVVLLFAVLSLPYRGLMVYNCFAGKPWLNLWYLLFAKSCIYLNSAINPLLYNFMSTRFRMAFRGMLCQESKGTVIMLKKRPPPPYS
ncbi:putative Thyrotropin-releasing hormone receptor [Hypsibius exemplaris]|uniref:Thyrotropin-releasing hormone receptor n=1 Tax=Hypsibius exemplaris TaxID=2072580 RepID=A0A1W0X3X3_HYPEX|nr:putative Thyrotropin-releasing hormone receptor [Hypsibius exemplaris]